MLKNFTICLPSNRPFGSAKPSIDSAIAFAASRGAALVVSDNSGDIQKHEHYLTVPDHVIYSVATGLGPMENLFNTLEQCQTEFILLMGDDDLVRGNDAMPTIDFAVFGPEYVGVKPAVELRSQSHGIRHQAAFSILQNNPFERMLSYCEKADGSNAAYYSYYRKSVFEALVRLIADCHPTKGGYIDWAMVLSLMAFGKMAADPSTIFTYAMGRWGEKTSDIQGQRQKVFRSAGLPDHAVHFEPLFGFADCFAFLSGKVSPLSDTDKQRALRAAAIIYVQNFLSDTEKRPEIYVEFSACITALAIEARSKDPSPGHLLALVLPILEQVKPGLAEAYMAFFAGAGL